VVYLPPWKMMEFVRLDHHPNYENKSHVPKHQPVIIEFGAINALPSFWTGFHGFHSMAQLPMGRERPRQDLIGTPEAKLRGFSSCWFLSQQKWGGLKMLKVFTFFNHQNITIISWMRGLSTLYWWPMAKLGSPFALFRIWLFQHQQHIPLENPWKMISK